MSSIRVGDRVGVVLFVDSKCVISMGSGTVVSEQKIHCQERETGQTIPLIQLDSGGVVPGHLVWWSEYSAMARRIYNWEAEGREIKTVGIEALEAFCSNLVRSHSENQGDCHGI